MSPRNRIGTLCSVASLVMLIPSSDARAGLTPSWTQYQGDAAHSAHVAARTAPPSPEPLWTATATSLGEASLFAGAVTDGQHVYVSAFKGGGTDQVVAIDPATGQKSWGQDFVPYFSSISAPAVGSGRVYVHQWGHSGISGGNASQYPYVFGLDPADGRIRFATAHSGQWSSGSRPTVAGNQVFAAGGYYGGLDAYQAVTGAKGWFANVNQQYGWIPAADDQRVYVYMGSASASPGPYQGTLYAFDRSTGAGAFTIVNADDRFTRYNGTVTLGGDADALTLTTGSAGTTLVSFDLGARSVRWRSAGNYSGSLAVDRGVVFADAGIELALLNESTGEKLDSWFAPAGHALAGNLLVTDNLIFAQTDAATYAIDRDTLGTVWSTNTVGDLALGDGLLLISNSAAVTAFAVPEPGVGVLLSLSVVVLARRRRRRR